MNYTTNLNLKKPEGTDFYNVGDFNDNADIIDAALQGKADAADLAGKVDKVTGKGLSSNDFTDALKDKLDGIESGAEANVKSDWNASSGDAQILNKPTIPTVPTNVSDFNNDAGYLTGQGLKTVNGNSLVGSGNINITAGISKSNVAVTIPVAAWSSNSATVTVQGVTSSNDVIISPANASREDYVDAGIWCSAQATNSLTFTCEETPENAVTVNVLILT